MALTNATVTFNVEDMTGVKFDARRTKVWVTTNVENDTVIDKGAKKIRLGSGNIQINPDGTGSATVWVPGPDANPRTWQTTFHVDYPDRNRREQRVQRHFGPFTITGNADLANLVDEQAVPPTYITQVTQQLDAKVAQATTAANNAATTAATAAAAAVAAEVAGETAAAQAARVAAESAAARARDISDIDSTDDAVDVALKLPGGKARATLSASIAHEVGTPGTPTHAELTATFASSPASRDTLWPGVGRKVSIVGEPAFFARIMNIGTGAPLYREWWSANNDYYDWAWAKDSIDKAYAVGANTVRFLGIYSAYEDNPAVYKQRYMQHIDYIKSLGLRVIPSLLDPASPSEAPRTVDRIDAFKAMITDLVTPYIGDQQILVWDIGNEWDCTNPTQASIAAALATHLHGLDPSAKVTVSQTMDTAGDVRSAALKLAAVESIVDVQDLHIYSVLGQLRFSPPFTDRLALSTQKPIMVAECGAAGRAGSSGFNGGGRFGQAAVLRLMRRLLASGGDLVGMGVWKSLDHPENGAKFGLWDDNGAPTPQLSEYLGFPERRLDVVSDMIATRTHPVMLDNFERANSVSAVGNPEIGPAPVLPLASTFGVSNGATYVVTPNGTLPDLLLYDVRNSSPGVYGEFSINTRNATNVGVVFRANAAGSNYVAVRIVYTSGEMYLEIAVRSGGTTTPLAGWNFQGASIGAATRVPLSGFSSQATSAPLLLSIGVEPYSNEEAVVVINGVAIAKFDMAGLPEAANTHAGAYFGAANGDTNRLRHLEIRSRGRTY